MKISKEILDHCRYYNGGDITYNNPTTEMLAFCEKVWYEHMLANDNFLDDILSEYFMYGLREFNLGDGVPVQLKAVIANRYFAYQERVDIGDFKKFYKKEYLKEGD
jgi:hypothetical protein